MLRIPKLCGRGKPPCATAVNVRPVCESRIFCGGALIARVTGMLNCWPLLAPAIAMLPEYVPGARMPGVAVTVNVAPAAGVTVPLTGEICSQFPPVLTKAVAVNATEPAPWFETVSCAIAMLPEYVPGARMPGVAV